MKYSVVSAAVTLGSLARLIMEVEQLYCSVATYTVLYPVVF